MSLYLLLLGDTEVTANIYCKSRNLPNTDTQKTVQICGNLWVTQYDNISNIYMHILSTWRTSITQKMI